jgi:hypothetical protein
MEMKRSELKPPSQAQRIVDRLKQSNDMATANLHSVQGSGPTRVHMTVHRSGHQAQGEGHGPVHHGEGDITGKQRGPAHE